MRDYIHYALEIEERINCATLDTVESVCRSLDDFWKKYCEVDVTFFFFLRWTRHDHAAKGMWATLDYQLRQRLKELNIRG